MQARYAHIKNLITDRIDAGAWRPGERIASEHELVRQVGASRMTVNRALKELESEGVLTRVAGVGTFVAEARLQHPSGAIRELREDVEARGARYTAEVLRLDAARATPELARAFGPEAPGALPHSLLVHRADALPVALEERWVNPKLAPHYLDQDFTRISPTRYLLDIAPLQRLEQRIEATRGSAEACRWLAIHANEPLLLITRRSWSRDRVASVAHLYYVGSRYTLEMGSQALPALPPAFADGKTNEPS